MQRFGRFRSEAEVGWPVQPTDSVENDPIRTFGNYLVAESFRYLLTDPW